MTWLSDLDFNIFSDEILIILQENLCHNRTDFDEQGLPSIDSKFPSSHVWPLEQQWVSLVPVLNDELWNIWRHLKYLPFVFATSEQAA